MPIRDWSNFIGGRTALVTGCGAGVGRAIAMHMARAGAEVWINDLDLERAESVVAEIEAEGGKAHADRRRRLRPRVGARRWRGRPGRSTSS